MWFVNPAMWWWAVALAVPIILYLVRHKPRKRRVATLLFFKTIAREHMESAWLRKLKKVLSLLLTLAILLAAIAALTRPIIAPQNDEMKSLVIVLDRSASMAALDGPATTRLDRAITQTKNRLDAVPAGVPVSLMVYDTRPRILLARSLNRRELHRALDEVRARPILGRPDPALRLAERLAAIEAPATIWHICDTTPPVSTTDELPEPAVASNEEPIAEDAEQQPDALEAEVKLVHLPVAQTQPTNVGVTGFALRRVPMQPDQLQAFVQVHASGEKTVEAELELRLADELAGLRKLKIKPGENERLLIPIKAKQGDKMRISVVAQDDALAADNEVAAWIPPLDPIRVLWVSPEPDPFTELALRVLGDDTQVQVFHTTPDAYPPAETVDVVVFQGWMPDPWPADQPAIVIDPPNGSGPVQVAPIARGGLPLERVRPTDRHHPLLFGVATPRVALTQTAVLATDAMNTGLQPLWQGPSGAVLAAGDVRGQRIVVMAFAPEQSEALPLMASYPMLVGNAVYWCAESNHDQDTVRHRPTGELIELDAEQLTWQAVDENTPTVNEVDRWVELDRVGLWEAKDGVRGSASLLDAGETILNIEKPDSESDDANATGGAIFGGDLTELLLVLALGILLLESYLFHRRGVY